MTLQEINFSVLQEKAKQKGFLLDGFIGFVLLEIESGADLYFGTIAEIENYLNVCDLSESELKTHYGFITDNEI